MDTTKWTSAIDEITSEFKSHFESLTGEQLNRKPDSKTWSIAQNIDHLIVINRTYYPVVKDASADKYTLPWIARFEWLVNYFGKTILESVGPDRRKKMKTFKLWEPKKSTIDDDILSKFEHHQEELKALIEESSDLLDKGVIISSPANRNIVYKLETAFDIIVTHERRHLQQALEVKELFKL